MVKIRRNNDLTSLLGFDLESWFQQGRDKVELEKAMQMCICLKNVLFSYAELNELIKIYPESNHKPTSSNAAWDKLVSDAFPYLKVGIESVCEADITLAFTSLCDRLSISLQNDYDAGFTISDYSLFRDFHYSFCKSNIANGVGLGEFTSAINQLCRLFTAKNVLNNGTGIIKFDLFLQQLLSAKDAYYFLSGNPSDILIDDPLILLKNNNKNSCMLVNRNWCSTEFPVSEKDLFEKNSGGKTDLFVF